MAEEKEQKQGVRMGLVRHPVTFSGKVVEFNAADGSFSVQFDGPVPTTKFWPSVHSEQVVVSETGESWEVRE